MQILPLVSSPVQVANDQNAEFSSLFFLHTFNTYHLLNRLNNDTRSQQLQLIKSFASSKACNPNHLLQLGFTASRGGRPNLETADFSLNACLSALLASPSPDYHLISIVLRKLICLSGLQDTEGGKNDGAYRVYRQAYQIIVGLKDGEYPIEEGKWLATTAWNKSGLAVRLHQFNVAERWMKMGLDLARHLKGMEKYVEGMEEYFANFEKLCGCGAVDGSRGNDGEESSSRSQPVLV